MSYSPWGRKVSTSHVTDPPMSDLYDPAPTHVPSALNMLSSSTLMMSTPPCDFFFFFKIYYFCLYWVFIALHRLSRDEQGLLFVAERRL